jgi:hypothetical protein
MTNYARIIAGVAIDVSTDPASRFHPQIAAEFVEVPDDVSHGWQLVDEDWFPPEVADPIEAEPKRRLRVTPVEFKLLFQPGERLAIRQAREYQGEDGAQQTFAWLIDDWWSIVDDPRLTTVDLGLSQTQAGLDMLVTAGILTQQRRDEMALGMVD